MGPFKNWPTGQRLRILLRVHRRRDEPVLPGDLRGHRPDRAAEDPEEGYHFTEDMTDKAIAWVRQQTVAHARQAVLRVLRARRDPRASPGARRSGPTSTRAASTPAGTRCARRPSPARRSSESSRPTAELTARPDEIPAWDDMPDELKPVLARQMEAYAGFLEHTDHHVGRLIDALEDLDVLDDTLVYYIIGDNGASAEGTINGTFNELARPQRCRRVRDGRDRWRRTSTSSAPRTRTTTTRSAGRTRWTRRTSGRSRSPRTGAEPATARSCTGPTASQAQGEVRPQFHHVIDIAATVLDVAGLPEPSFVHGIQQKPLHGVEHGATRSTTPAPPDRRETQYFEMFCNRGIYHKGWTAVTRHSTPWMMGAVLPDLRRRRVGVLRPDTDWTPGPRPRRGTAREARRPPAAVAHRGGQVPGAAARRPPRRAASTPTSRGGRQLVTGNSQLLFGGMGRLSENSVLNMKNKSHSVTAEIVVPDGGARGVIIAQGGAFAGWALVPARGQARVLPQPLRAPALQGLRRDAGSRRARTRCGWSSRTTAAAWPRAAP